MIYSGLICAHGVLQLFLWERFKKYGPQPSTFEVINVVRVEDENRIVRSVPDKSEKIRPRDGLILSSKRARIPWSISTPKSTFLSCPTNIPLEGWQR